MNWIVNKVLTTESLLFVSVNELDLIGVVSFLNDEMSNYPNIRTIVLEKEDHSTCILSRDKNRPMGWLMGDWSKTAVKHSIPIEYYQDEYGWIVFELNGDLYQCHF